MTWILNWILITTIWVLGVTIVTTRGMALYFIREWMDRKGSRVYEPVLTCEWCMPSLHGVVGYLFAVGTGVIAGFEFKHIVAYPLVISGASLLCGVTWALVKRVIEEDDTDDPMGTMYNM